MAEQLKAPEPIDPEKWQRLIAEYDKEMSAVEAARVPLNSRANAAREILRSNGIDVSAANAARAFIKTDEEKRDAFDTTYQIARRAVGEPIQGLLFRDPEAVEAAEADSDSDEAEAGDGDGQDPETADESERELEAAQ